MFLGVAQPDRSKIKIIAVSSFIVSLLAANITFYFNLNVTPMLNNWLFEVLLSGAYGVGLVVDIKAEVEDIGRRVSRIDPCQEPNEDR